MLKKKLGILILAKDCDEIKKIDMREYETEKKMNKYKRLLGLKEKDLKSTENYTNRKLTGQT